MVLSSHVLFSVLSMVLFSHLLFRVLSMVLSAWFAIVMGTSKHCFVKI